MLSLGIVARNCLGGWVGGFLILLVGHLGSKSADGFTGILLLALYSLIVTFIVGFPLALLASRFVARGTYRPSLPIGTVMGALTALCVLILIATPFYGLSSVAIVFTFVFTPIVGAIGVVGAVTGFLTALELRSATRQDS